MDYQQSTHLGIYGIALRGQQVLLIRKGRGPYTGLLDLPGGKPELYESPAEALSREIYEETGYTCTDMQLYTVETARADWSDATPPTSVYHIGIYYRVTLDCITTSPKKDADGHDALGADWYDLDEELLEQCAPIVRQVLGKIGRE